MTQELKDERAAFETWAIREFGFDRCDLVRQEDGYAVVGVDNAWDGWQARAAQPPAAEGAEYSRYIIIGYGETDYPQSAFVNDQAQLLDAVMGMMYMKPSNADDEIREAYRRDLDDADEWSGGIWDTEFEIGGITIYDTGERLAAPASSASERAAEDAGGAIDYDRVVQICEAHGIGLPVDCIEMVVEIIRLAAPASRANKAVGLTDEQREVIGQAINLFARGWQAKQIGVLNTLLAATQPIDRTARLALDEGQIDALHEAICWARDDGLPGTADTLREILVATQPSADAVSLSDDSRECLTDVVTHFDNLRAGLCAQRSEARSAQDTDNAAYWEREIRVLERMKSQAERVIAGAPAEAKGGKS
jgi:hypothetical protein